jgi:hypothetical protein
MYKSKSEWVYICRSLLNEIEEYALLRDEANCVLVVGPTQESDLWYTA